MKHAHSLAAVLVWILLVPPAVDSNGIRYIDRTAPLAEWQRGTKVFDSSDDCEAERKKLVAIAESHRADPASQTDYELRRLDATLDGLQCVSTDDPRLQTK
jgi:hypothetical protein